VDEAVVDIGVQGDETGRVPALDHDVVEGVTGRNQRLAAPDFTA
jgi:hypothetical protein